MNGKRAKTLRRVARHTATRLTNVILQHPVKGFFYYHPLSFRATYQGLKRT